MQSLNFNAEEWIYVADPMGRIGQGYYKKRNNPTQTITATEFENRRSKPVTIKSGEGEHNVNNINVATQGANAGNGQSLTPWDNPLLGEQSAKKEFSDQQVSQKSQPVKAAPVVPTTAVPNEEVSKQEKQADKKAKEIQQDQGGEGGPAGGDATVICTELVRQGLMERREQQLSFLYAQKYLGENFMTGYHFWAVPYVRLMRKSRLATKCIQPFVSHRTNEILFRLGRREKGSSFGRLICAVHDPLCQLMGYFGNVIKNLKLQFQ